MDAEIADDFLGEQHPSSTKETRSKLEPEGARPPLNGCFDCNICLDYAAEPVVTLCGHLYCWPCIYRWLRLQSSNPQCCPVCKATLSQTALVPLYGRGYDSKAADDALDVPRRPSVPVAFSFSDSETPRAAATQRAQRHHHPHSYHDGPDANYAMSSSSMTTSRLLHPTMLGGVAIAVLPWVLGEQGMGLYYPNPYPVASGGGDRDSRRLRRQEMQAWRSLHRISMFLFCCLVLCLLVF